MCRKSVSGAKWRISRRKIAFVWPVGRTERNLSKNPPQVLLSALIWWNKPRWRSVNLAFRLSNFDVLRLSRFADFDRVVARLQHDLRPAPRAVFAFQVRIAFVCFC